MFPTCFGLVLPCCVAFRVFLEMDYPGDTDDVADGSFWVTATPSVSDNGVLNPLLSFSGRPVTGMG